MLTKLTMILAFTCAIEAATAAADSPAPKPAGAAKTEATPASAAAPTPPGKKFDWEKMNLGERKKYMKATVLPEMKKLFVAFDAKKYANMTCQTCHGDKAAETKYKMPNPQLPKLPQPTDRAGFMALKPEFAKFMGTEVKPKMVALLGLPEATPANPKGFGCYDCHTKQAAAAK